MSNYQMRFIVQLLMLFIAGLLAANSGKSCGGSRESCIEDCRSKYGSTVTPDEMPEAAECIDNCRKAYPKSKAER